MLPRHVPVRAHGVYLGACGGGGGATARGGFGGVGSLLLHNCARHRPTNMHGNPPPPFPRPPLMINALGQVAVGRESPPLPARSSAGRGGFNRLCRSLPDPAFRPCSFLWVELGGLYHACPPWLPLPRVHTYLSTHAVARPQFASVRARAAARGGLR
eukprot:scaffold7225_cov379-Prasinococcus_capsulatus_cf.AAC.9